MTNIVIPGAADFRAAAGAEADSCVSLARPQCWWIARDTGVGIYFEALGRLPGNHEFAAYVRGLDAELPADLQLSTRNLHLTWGPGAFGLFAVPGNLVQRGNVSLIESVMVANSTYTLASGTLQANRALVGVHPVGVTPSAFAALPRGLFLQDGGSHLLGQHLLIGTRTDPWQPGGPSMGDGEYRLRGGVLQVPYVWTAAPDFESVLRIDGGLLTSPRTTGADRLRIEGLSRLVVGSEAGRQGELYLTQARFSGLGGLEVGIDGGRGTMVLQHTPVQAQALRVGVDAAAGAQNLVSFNGGGSRVQVGSATVGQGTGGGGWLALASGAALDVAGELRVGHGAAGTLELRGDSRLAAGSLSFGESAVAYLWAAPELSGLLSSAAGSRLEVRDSMRLAVEVLHEGRFVVSNGSTLRLGGAVRGGGAYSGDVVFEGAYAPGALHGVDFDGGSVSFAEGAVLTLRIASLEFHDSLTGIGTLDFAGALHLDFVEGFSLDDGGTLALLDHDTLALAWDPARITVSGFDQARLDLAGLAASGTLAVAAVPEPGSWALMVAGLLSVLGLAKRRRRVPH